MRRCAVDVQRRPDTQMLPDMRCLLTCHMSGLMAVQRNIKAGMVVALPKDAHAWSSTHAGKCKRQLSVVKQAVVHAYALNSMHINQERVLGCLTTDSTSASWMCHLLTARLVMLLAHFSGVKSL